ncbi:hypothetical protein B2G71_13200 [Novosphingobium sp. PC22D]|nr:hypothetical protein B2G71_13200 [Novosphingobium sp. PC22D]
MANQVSLRVCGIKMNRALHAMNRLIRGNPISRAILISSFDIGLRAAVLSRPRGDNLAVRC